MSELIVPGPLDWDRFTDLDPAFPRLASRIRNAEPGTRHPMGLLGLPFDGAIPTRQGARYGPEAIRQALLRLAADDGRHALTALEIGDYGDVSCVQGNVPATHERGYEAARQIVGSTDLPVFLGGDHSLTYPCFRAVAEGTRPLGLITFDAHHDVRTYTPEHISSGTPFRRCLELGDAYLRGATVVQIGLRPFANSRTYADYCREKGITCFTVQDVEEMGIREIAARAAQIAGDGTAGVYLSIDIDAVDAAFAPGASATGPGGLTAREILAGVEAIVARVRLVAADLMEVSPPLDQGARTSNLAAMILATILAGYRRGKT